ncbi:MAG: ribulose bisphosphate carboxylase small subunit [Pseudomonadota bacterium]
MTLEIRDYPSRAGVAASKKLGTFSYLPALDAAAIRGQVAYMLSKGWSCAIEHVEPARAAIDYWYMWKLPLFGEREVDAVMSALNACRNANPGHHIRLVGYDSRRQTQGLAMVVYRGEGPREQNAL